MRKVAAILIVLFTPYSFGGEYSVFVGLSEPYKVKGVKGRMCFLVKEGPLSVGACVLNYKGESVFILDKDRVVVFAREVQNADNNQVYTGGTCWIKEKRRSDILVLARIAPNKSYLKDIVKTWKIDSAKEVITEIDIPNIRCINDIHRH